MTEPIVPEPQPLEPVPPTTWVRYFDPSGVDFYEVTCSWQPVSTYDDGSPALVQSYIVEVSLDGGATYVGAVTVDGETTIATLPRYMAGTDLSWRVRAVPFSGLPSDPSEPVTVNLPADTQPPGIPTAPTVLSRLSVLSCSWNGTFADNSTMPADFSRVEVHMGTSAGFTPSAATLIENLRGAGLATVTNLPYGSTRWFKLRALDVRGNASDYSVERSATVVATVAADIADGSVAASKVADGAIEAAKLAAGSVTQSAIAANAVVAGKIAAGTITSTELAANSVTAGKVAAGAIQAGSIASNAITTDKLAAGALDAFQITSPDIRSSARTPGLARYEADSYGIHFYNQQGAATIDFDAASGDALITGVIRTGDPGTQRVVLDNALWANGYTGIRLYDTSGNTGHPELKAHNSGRVYLTSGEVVTSSTGHGELMLDKASWALGGKFLRNTSSVESYAAKDGQQGARLIGISDNKITGVISVVGHRVNDSMEFSRWVEPDSRSAGMWLNQAGDTDLAVRSLTISAHKPDHYVSVQVNGSMTTASDLTVTGQLSGGMTGEIKAWPVGYVPSGWLECNGAALLRADYPVLANVLLGTFGGPDASRFYLPNYTGRTLVGRGTGTFAAMGARVGAETVAGAAHTHTLSDSSYAQIQFSATTTPITMRRVSTPAFTSTHAITGTGAAAGASNSSTVGAGLAGRTDSTTPAATSVVQPSAVVLYIIKT